MRWLAERRIGVAVGPALVPIVPAAVLFDLGLGSAALRPGEAAGYAACEAARDGDCAAGSIGAGTGATVAKAAGIERALKGGLASACERLHDGTRVAALVADKGIDYLDGPVKTITGARSPVPYSGVLESAYVPNAARVVSAALSTLRD